MNESRVCKIGKMRNRDRYGMFQDGESLYSCVKRTVAGRNPRLWSRFLSYCLSRNLLPLQALFTAVGTVEEYKAWERSRSKIRKSSNFDDYVEDQIKRWMHVRRHCPSVIREYLYDEVALYWTAGGEVKPIYVHRPYPTCEKCGRPLFAQYERDRILGKHAFFFCPKC